LIITAEVVAYNRPEYLRKCLFALTMADGVDVAGIHVTVDILPSGLPNPEVIDVIEFFGLSYTIMKKKGGCNGTVFAALSHGFKSEADFVILIEEDIICSPDWMQYIKWASKEFEFDTRVKTVALWNHENGWAPPARLPENEIGRVALQCFFKCWGWGTFRREWEGIKTNWTTGNDSHDTSWDVILHSQLGDRYEVCPSMSRAYNCGEEGGVHRGAAYPKVLVDEYLPESKPDYWLDTSATIHRRKTAYVMLGRFGDLIMMCRSLQRPSIVVCLKKYRSAVDELFPQHKVFEVGCNGSEPITAAQIASNELRGHKIVIVQQNGMDPEITRGFRSYQSQQEYTTANVL